MDPNVTSIELQCRMCLDMQHSNEEMTSLFEMMEGNFTLSDIFTNISNLELEPKENIPRNVCSSCLTIIINFHNLLLQFQETEEFLKKIGLPKIVCESSKIDTDQSDAFDSHENQDSPDSISEKEVNDSEVTESDKFDEPDSVSMQNIDAKCYKNSEIDIKNIKSQKSEIEEVKNKDYVIGYERLESEKMIGENETHIIIESVKYTCEHCEDVFLHKISFNQHLSQRHNVHLKEKDFIKCSSKIIYKQPKMCPDFILLPTKVSSTMMSQCKVCKQNYETEKELKKHLNVHKTHVCPVCGLSFLKKYYLTDHLVIHSSQKKHVCSICNASFKHRHGLSAHKNSHKTFRDSTCETCGLSFKDKGTLRVHIRLKHNDVKHYPCPECPLKFKLKSFLDLHFKRKHTERTKDFMCSTCGVAYLNKSTLLRHIGDNHSGRTPQFTCTICSKPFRAKFSLKKHLFSIHKMCPNK